MVPDETSVTTEDASTNNSAIMCHPRGPVSSKYLCEHVLLNLDVESISQLTKL